jgi:serine protease inhibitor ecotin
MKKLLVILLVLIPIAAFSQDNSAQKPKTKFEAFSSKTGSIVKFYDIKLPKITSASHNIETRIRIVKSESDVSKSL